jgi:hypothetical protein
MTRFDRFTKMLVANGFRHYMPGARLTGFICYERRFYNRPCWWKFWQEKEWMFLRGGEWAYTVGNVYKFGRYEDMAVELFGGMKFSGPKSTEDLLLGRSRFIEAYCKEKGWTMPLDIQQILEVRAQDGWKNPSINVHENQTTEEI